MDAPLEVQAETAQAEEKFIPLYSLGSLGGATFLGGPLAGGIILRRNFINLGDKSKGNLALSVAVLATFAIFGAIFLIPEEAIEKIPGSVIPAFYTAIIVQFAKATHGNELARRKGLKEAFYSGWKAFRVGLLGLLVTLVGLVAGALLVSADADTYNQHLATFSKAEDEALQLYPKLKNGAKPEEILAFLDKSALPAWDRAKTAAQAMASLQGVEEANRAQARRLVEYVELRQKAYRLYREAAATDGNYRTDAIEKAESEVAEFKL